MEKKKILLLECSNSGFYLNNHLAEVEKVLCKEKHTIVGGSPMNYGQLIQWCKEADCAIFDFWQEDNAERVSYHQQVGLVALTRMLFEFKKPVLVSMLKRDYKPLSTMVSMLHAEEIKDTVFKYTTSEEILIEIRKRFL